jgi:glycosyltransferase involved in cell wall biosynthesis
MQIGIMWAWLTRTPYMMWSESHHMRVKKRGLLRRLIKKMLYRPIVSWASACLVTGSYARDYMVSYGATSKQTFIVANTPDVHWFMRESSKYRENKNEIKIQMDISQKSVILFVGGLYETKGIQYLIDVYSVLKTEQDDVCLLIVGDGPLRSNLESHCIQKNIRDVHFVGFQQTNELPRYYGIADVFVLPSVHETWGTVVNEAMACGLPVITTRTVGASGDLVKPGQNGFIVQERNVDELYRALKEIISQPDLALAMGEMSRKIIEPWDHEHSVEEFVKAAKLACKDSHP